MPFCALRRDEQKGNREILGILASASKHRIGAMHAWEDVCVAQGALRIFNRSAESRGSGMGCTYPDGCHGPGSGSSDATHKLGDLGQPT